MKRTLLPLLACALASLSAAHAQDAAPSASPAAATGPVKDIPIVLHTDKGDIEATIFATKVPATAANFLNLAQRKFYDGLTFHRVISEFMIQGGDPDGDGRGGPGYEFEDESNGPRRFDKPGVFAMANHSANTNGSQFFITHNEVPHLNDGGGYGHYTIFGQTTKGQDVVNKITQGDHIKSIDILESTAPLFEAQAKNLALWNGKLKLPKR